MTQWRELPKAASNLAMTLEHDIARYLEIDEVSMQAVISGMDDAEVMALPARMRQLVLFDRSANAAYLGTLLGSSTICVTTANSRGGPCRRFSRPATTILLIG
ncbi:hypothetical protein [Cupriavidus pinatubonensis]|uniref:hypothetical protein n=1 Tax=Cupriavidus pinatubonensis TaxID=248026 RepID=UPI001CC3B55C|nr:hypothetical protein [Cupriavidus pinatubonensis]